MLKDYLLTECQRVYNESPHGACPDCNNETACNHDCDECLRQVHWFSGNQGRSDYDCPWLLLRYVDQFTERYSGQIASALQSVDLACYPMYNILSIGCGAAPDLMAFEELGDGKRIYYRGYDRNPLWSNIHNAIMRYTDAQPGMKSELVQEDIFNVFSGGMQVQSDFNVVIIQYLLSHLYNIGQECFIDALFKEIINNVVHQRAPGSPFLIIITDIDSVYKGRNTWYWLLDKLEDAGYYGRALARSSYPNGDLGAERWSDHKTSAVFGNIKYSFCKNESEHDCAQLIIELR